MYIAIYFANNSLVNSFCQIEKIDYFPTLCYYNFFLPNSKEVQLSTICGQKINQSAALLSNTYISLYPFQVYRQVLRHYEKTKPGGRLDINCKTLKASDGHCLYRKLCFCTHYGKKNYKHLDAYKLRTEIS